MPSLKAGQFLFNRRYELVELLGAGGMGVVWRAWDHTGGGDVALKFLPSVLVLQDREMQRLREEVRAGKELRHSRIVATYGMEVEDATAAIVMEYVAGETLKEKLEAQAHGFFEPEEIEPWVRDVCEALGYLHDEAKRIHRDVKPANVMVDGEGRAKLMDFGISHRIKESVSRHSKTSEGQAAGSSSTLAYASPQQLSGKPSDKADDIYSLGATLYELLTGTPPFYRGGLEAVALQIKTEPVTPILERRQELVAEGLNASTGQSVAVTVEETILACLAKQREERPASAPSVVEGLTAKSGPLSPLSGAPQAKPSAKNTPDTHRPNRPSSDSSTLPAPVPLRGQPSHRDRRSQSGPLWALALLVIASLGAWAFLSKPKEVIKVVPKVVEDIAAKQEAEKQRQRADDLEKKHHEEQEKRLAAEAAAAKVKADAAAASVPAPTQTPVPPPTVPKALPVGTVATATKEHPFENSLGMKFVPVPIGAGESKGQRVLFSIWETRSKDYAAFVKETGYDAGEDWKTHSYNDVPVGRGEGERAEESSHPVADVSHDDGVAFCAWLTKKDRASGLIGLQDEYRLPTDTEWSYAVGIGEKEDASASPKEKDGGLEDVYPWGGPWPPPAGSGNYADETAKANGTDLLGIVEGYTDGYATTAPVGRFKENGLGIYDMGGNLWEWTSSLYDSGSSDRVVRGGSWNRGGRGYLASSFRFDYSPGFRSFSGGFRCVVVVGRSSP
jgi:serine/threonine protein kinase